MDFSKYENKMLYPEICAKPIMPLSGNPDDFFEYAENLKNHQVKADERYKKLNEYHKETARLKELFKNDSFEELGIKHNPKKDLLFSISLEHGHSDGLKSVFYWMEELVELIL
jgi:hypothetical protein